MKAHDVESDLLPLNFNNIDVLLSVHKVNTICGQISE